ncbi:heat shock 70 kDa protein 12A-like isoform X2 [Crassostrea angulata]|nr:heat shock 70 kDa protein 12A-like isoform X2 [Crassostrea angulata]XP_052703244.1 heat shock 70 kDa protein 12A-like isoform X2 [Crassostrea angulata]XP_052703245.1 heat shock 70 kDa protein 12A-like isoform X2 [Crassostrea angulata]
MASKARDHIVVVAIDFGTTYSGYAYSFRSDFIKYETDHLNKIHINNWNCGDLMSEKTPTTLLLDKNKEFVSFGYAAENDYSSMTEEKRKEHYYFRRFKMMLYDKDGKLTLTRDTVLKDLRDKEMPAIDVFARSIEYLKDEFVKKFEERNLQVSITPLNENVTWILTVPAIWDEPAKQFMEEAAELAGISKESLLICLEPEAAAVYCKWIQIERDDDALNVMKPGRRFLVLDAGGGTIDMAMQEVREDGKLQEINRAEGGDWGGIFVDDEFKQMLEGIVSKPIVEAFRMKHTGDYIALFRYFEKKKRQKQTGKSVRVDIPPTLLEIAEDFIKCIEDHGLKDDVELKRGKLQIKVRKFEEFFNKVLDKIAVKVEEMLVSDTAEGTKVIIMVGGFSECELLQSRIRNSFPSCTVVIPQECGLAVLKGAVLFGHDPDIIAARVVKYTYGVDTYTRFIKDKHPESKKKIINGIEYCTDNFDIFVNKGKLVHCNEETEKNYFPIHENQTSVNFAVFASNKVEPQYTDGCKGIGSLTVPMPDTTGGTRRRVKAKFKFGATKITVVGFDETSKKSVDVKIDFLENKL